MDDTRCASKEGFLENSVESGHLACIIHSSGSTGLPKPIYLSQRLLVKVAEKNTGMTAFSCVPFYHGFGMSTLLRAIHSDRQIHIYNAALPLTEGRLVESMQLSRSEQFACVPYALKVLGESQRGMEALAARKWVWYAGSACPDSLGNKLTGCGVRLASDYRASETGPLMSSFRADGDTAWNYLRPLQHAEPFVKFEEQGNGVFELVVLDGFPSKSTSNRPDKSYATKDLFEKHPTVENAYKYLARVDDTIVLMNGEKANPLILEGAVREHKFVTEAVVFGSNKDELGAMIIPSSSAAKMERDEVLSDVWPIIVTVQQGMPAYARLSKAMVVILPSDVSYPSTDKGTFIRQAIYRKFLAEIEHAYEERSAADLLIMDEPELQAYLRKETASILHIDDPATLGDDSDFFAIGMDSLQSTQLRKTVTTTIDTGGNRLALNVVYEHPNVRELASVVHGLRTGQAEAKGSSEREMGTLITRYGNIARTNRWPDGYGRNGAEEECIVVTGATGSLGAHIVAQLAAQEAVKKIYCLVRVRPDQHAHMRIVKSFKARKLFDMISSAGRKKIIAIPTNFPSPGLDLDPQVYKRIVTEITSVIHCAWPVNFNLRLSSFEPDIAATKNLLQLCLDSERSNPAKLCFCSSISTVLHTESAVVLEDLPVTLSCAADLGYAQSKLVAEHLCHLAADQTGMTTHILRIGQISGDTRNGVWKTSEALPLIIASASTVGSLPRLNSPERWLPVDTVAMAVIEITQSSAPSGVMNIINPSFFSWDDVVLPYLRASGLNFDEISPTEWLKKLELSNPDPVANPPMKLLDFFRSTYDDKIHGESASAPAMRQWQVQNAQKYSTSFSRGWRIDQGYVDKLVACLRSQSLLDFREEERSP